MILIVDNGQCYSDHAIYFLDLSAALSAHIEDVKALVAATRHGQRVVASAERFDWYEGKAEDAIEFLVEWLGYLDWKLDDPGEDAVTLPRVHPDVVAALIAKQKPRPTLHRLAEVAGVTP